MHTCSSLVSAYLASPDAKNARFRYKLWHEIIDTEKRYYIYY